LIEYYFVFCGELNNQMNFGNQIKPVRYNWARL